MASETFVPDLLIAFQQMGTNDGVVIKSEDEYTLAGYFAQKGGWHRIGNLEETLAKIDKSGETSLWGVPILVWGFPTNLQLISSWISDGFQLKGLDGNSYKIVMTEEETRVVADV